MCFVVREKMPVDFPGTGHPLLDLLDLVFVGEFPYSIVGVDSAGGQVGREEDYGIGLLSGSDENFFEEDGVDIRIRRVARRLLGYREAIEGLQRF